MLKSRLIALALGASSMAISSAAVAQVKDVAPATNAASAAPFDKNGKEMKQMQKMFADLFGPVNNEPIDPQRFALAQQTVGKIMPKGIYAKMMGGIVNKAMGSILGGTNGMSDMMITQATGVELGDVNLDPAKRAAVTQLFDSSYAERSKLMQDTMTPMFDKMISVIEPPMREGMSRAYARKFTQAQLTELNRFFATSTGGVYAAEAFALQADPEVMQSMMSALPLMLSEIKLPASEIEAKMNALPKPRKLDQLSDAEIAQMAQLLGTTSEALKDYSMATSSLSEDAAAATEENPFANETGAEPWYDGANWTAAQRNNVNKLSNAYTKTQEKNDIAYDAYQAAEKDAVGIARKRFLAEGWKPEPQDSMEGAQAGPGDTGDAAAAAGDAAAAARPPK